MCKIFTSCWFLTIITVMRCSAVTTGACSELICKYFKSSGSILIDRNASMMTHVIDVGNESSIIMLTMFPSNKSEIANIDTTMHIIQQNQAITVELLPEKLKENFIYVSGTPALNISFSANEEWIDLVVDYEELKFEMRNCTIENDNGTLYPGVCGLHFQKMNTMTVYKLTPKPRAWNESSVLVSVEHLYIDEFAGDYLLIGAGREVFNGPPAAYLTGNVTKRMKYHVEADNMYVAILHTSKQIPEFEIEWLRVGSTIKEPDEEPEKVIVETVSEAMPICFYNESCISEFSYEKDSPLIAWFKDKFADVANKYVKGEKMNVQKINSAAVQIVHISTILPADKNLPDGVIYALVTIVQNYDTKRVVFQRQQLGRIVEAFDADDEAKGHKFGFKVGKCPNKVRYNWWYVAAALLVTFSTAFFVGVWICAYNHMWSRSKKRKASKKHLPGIKQRLSNELNHVAYINPTITITDESGHEVNIGNRSRNYANVQSDEDSETEIFNHNWIMKRKVSKTELPECKGESSGQIHMFKSLNEGERLKTSNLLWLKDRFGDAFSNNQSGVKIHDHDSPEDPHDDMQRNMVTSL